MPTAAWSSVKFPLVEKMTRRFDQTWNLMLMAITLSALATPAMTESDSKKEQTEDCVTAAMTDYAKANDALVQQTAAVMSVEATIAQRRLQEEYCLRFVRCSLDDQNSAYFEFNSTAASRTKRSGRYRVILIEPTAAQAPCPAPWRPPRPSWYALKSLSAR